MNNHFLLKPANLLAITLILIGLCLTLYKHFYLDFPLQAGKQQTVWTIESKLTVDPIADSPVTISLNLPSGIAGWSIIEENFASSGFGLSINRHTNNERKAVWTRQSLNDSNTLYYKMQVARNKSQPLKNIKPIKIIKPDLEKDSLAAIKRVTNDLIKKSSGSLSFTQLFIQQANNINDHNQDLAFLFKNSESSRLTTILDVLAYADIPAQRLRGIKLEDGRRRQQLSALIEIHDGKQWHVINTLTGELGLTDQFFIWQRGDQSIFNVTGAKNSKLEFALVSNTLPVKTILFMENNINNQPILDFSIYTLPIEQQGVFKKLLLIPIGAVIVVFFRIFIGLKTTGTFLPILIALAFVETTLLTGLSIFTIVVSIGLIIRQQLSKLNLLLVARVSAVVIVVILLMAMLSITSYKLGIDQALTVTFFPIIILAWTIERMSILWEEESMHDVIKQLTGSLLVAIVSYFAMIQTTIEHLTFNFPELSISILGIVILLGRYTGYRLTELFRFSSIKANV